MWPGGLLRERWLVWCEMLLWWWWRRRTIDRGKWLASSKTTSRTLLHQHWLSRMPRVEHHGRLWRVGLHCRLWLRLWLRLRLPLSMRVWFYPGCDRSSLLGMRLWRQHLLRLRLRSILLYASQKRLIRVRRSYCSLHVLSWYGGCRGWRSCKRRTGGMFAGDGSTIIVATLVQRCRCRRART